MDFTALIFAALKSAKTANERIDNLPLPMVFKGSLGTGGTISTLPTASSYNEGYVYIVITDGTYAGQTAKAGDTFISDGSAWVLVPSADEPSVIDDSVTSTALTWSSKKISDKYDIKSFKYTGDGNNPATITFPIKPTMVLQIYGDVLGYGNYSDPFFRGNTVSCINIMSAGSYTSNTTRSVHLNWTSDTTLEIEGETAQRAFNNNNSEYTVYYI